MAPGLFELRSPGPRGVRVIPRVQKLEGGKIVSSRNVRLAAGQERVDTMRGMLAVPDGHMATRMVIEYSSLGGIL